MSYKLSVVIEQDTDGYYAYCPELKGCQTQGESLAEAQANIREAIELYLETLSAEAKSAIDNSPIAPLTQLKTKNSKLKTSTPPSNSLE
jgi:predicted RNase H-like HicB family nuclease